MTRIGIHYARRRFVFSQSEIPQMRACIHSSSCNEKHATLTALAVKRTFFLDRNSSSYKELGKREILRKAILRACDDIYEPKPDDLIKQLREVFGEDMDAWLTDHLTLGISSLSSPGDLLNFFNDIRGILDILGAELVQENQIFFGSFGSLERNINVLV